MKSYRSKISFNNVENSFWIRYKAYTWKCFVYNKILCGSCFELVIKTYFSLLACFLPRIIWL